MSAPTVCFISSKGGSGKTVTSSAVGTFLAELGFRVLLVDTDAATNGMTLLYLEQLLGSRRNKLRSDTSGIGLFEAKRGQPPTVIAISPNLHFVPASFSMTDTENTDAAQFELNLNLLLLKRADYDFVLLDAQAGADKYAKAAVKAADQCVIVSEYDPVSAQGIERLKILFANVMDPATTHVLFNKVLAEFARVIGEGLAIARYLTPIPWDADVVRAFTRRDLAIDMKLANAYTLAIAAVTYSLFPDETGEAIDKWRGSAIQSSTEPFEVKLRELHAAEEYLLKTQFRRESATKLFSVFLTAMAVALTVSAAYVSRGNWLPRWSEYAGELVAVATAIISGGSIAISIFFKKMADTLSGAKESNLAIELTRVEQEKLKISLEAAEAAKRFNINAGIYESRRRRSAPPSST
jgi:cellulose biosynthesis protein BcsQ